MELLNNFLNNTIMISNNLFSWALQYINAIFSNWVGWLLIGIIVLSVIFEDLWDFIDYNLINKDYYKEFEENEIIKERYYSIRKNRFIDLMKNTIKNQDLTEKYYSIKNDRLLNFMNNAIKNQNLNTEYIDIQNKINTFNKMNFVKEFKDINDLKEYNEHLKEKYKKKNYKKEAARPEWLDQDLDITPIETEEDKERLKKIEEYWKNN